MININRSILIIAVLPLGIILLCLLSLSFIVSSSRDYIYTAATEVPSTDAALILGAAILRNGDLSPVLRDRTDQAIELYQLQKVKKIIASGDNSSLHYNEVQPIREYLLKKGIPEEDIFMDYAGFDTYSSIYRARDVFLVHSLTIVSQSFHLPRAVFIARLLGLTSYGVSADRGHYKVINYLREMAANLKAIANVAFHRTPKYLGEEIPINGDGRSSLPEKHTIPLW